MLLPRQVDAEHELLMRITSYAHRSACPTFGDILSHPLPDVMSLIADPGEMFVSRRRIVVFQRIVGELRYYAGGWCDQNRRHLEEDRILAEGCEMGAFSTVLEALVFTEQCLVDERDFAQIAVPRVPRA